MTKIQIKRVFEDAHLKDGFRVLVDRIWPRGVRKGDAAIELWAKDIAPSTALRKWFNHDPDKWSDFQKRYRAELVFPDAKLDDLLKAAGEQQLTLVYSARDTEHNQASVLREVLLEKGGPANN